MYQQRLRSGVVFTYWIRAWEWDWNAWDYELAACWDNRPHGLTTTEMLESRVIMNALEGHWDNNRWPAWCDRHLEPNPRYQGFR